MNFIYILHSKTCIRNWHASLVNIALKLEITGINLLNTTFPKHIDFIIINTNFNLKFIDYISWLSFMLGHFSQAVNERNKQRGKWIPTHKTTLRQWRNCSLLNYKLAQTCLIPWELSPSIILSLFTMLSSVRPMLWQVFLCTSETWHLGKVTCLIKRNRGLRFVYDFCLFLGSCEFRQSKQSSNFWKTEENKRGFDS